MRIITARRHAPRHAVPTRACPRTPVSGAVCALLTAAFLSPPGTAHAFGDGSFAGSLLRGSAHGGNALVANATQTVLSVGAIAKQSLGCNPALGQEAVKEDDDVSARLNYLGSITLPLPDSSTALRAKQLRNTGYATADDSGADVFEKATSSAISVLDGVVK